MEMYQILEIVLGCLIIGLGLFMLLAPEKATKKALRDNPVAVAKTKKSGVMEIIIGILWLIMCIVTMSM